MSPTTITRLTAAWEAEYRGFCESSLAERDYVYLWADGVHFRVRLEEDRLCTLVLIGVRPDGTKELVAVEDGYRRAGVLFVDGVQQEREEVVPPRRKAA